MAEQGERPYGFSAAEWEQTAKHYKDQRDALRAELESEREERDREREWRMEMTRAGERGEVSGWANRVEQAERKVAALIAAVEDHKRAKLNETGGLGTGVDAKLWDRMAAIKSGRSDADG